MCSGVSLPAGVAVGSSLSPATFSGAPPSSTLMCALAAQITDSQRLVIDCRLMTLAPVPLKTGKTSACSPKWPRKTSCSRAV